MGWGWSAAEGGEWRGVQGLRVNPKTLNPKTLEVQGGEGASLWGSSSMGWSIGETVHGQRC